MTSQRTTLVYLVTIGFLATLLAACNSSPSRSIPLSTMVASTQEESGQTPVPSLDMPVPLQSTVASPAFSPVIQETLPLTRLETVTSPSPYDGWQKYTNLLYGFSVCFPTDWTIVAETAHGLWIAQEPDLTLTLVVQFKRVDESLSIQRTGVGAGEIVSRGSISFLGQEISKDVLVYLETDKAVLYNYATEITIGQLVFALSLDDFDTDYESVALTEDIEGIVDQIVGSFELIK